MWNYTENNGKTIRYRDKDRRRENRETDGQNCHFSTMGTYHSCLINTNCVYGQYNASQTNLLWLQMGKIKSAELS
jgi:hypothetical protein